MNFDQVKKLSWKGIKSLEEAKELIDSNTILKWSEVRQIKRNFSTEDKQTLMSYFCSRLIRKYSERFSMEIITENILIWLSANGIQENLVDTFLEDLVSQDKSFQASKMLVEVALTSEVTESAHDQDIFDMAVALICELGIKIKNNRDKSQQIAPIEEIQFLQHVSTYLLSVSNNNSTKIRLSLMHYFGHYGFVHNDMKSFNRIMNRFGHTVIDHLFYTLFLKKSEGVSLQFILSNLPFVLLADSNCQRILHESFKYYMLKNPERFSIFLNLFVDKLNDESEPCQSTMLQHLGALYQVVSSVNHKGLAKDILIAIDRFRSKEMKLIMIAQIAEGGNIRTTFKELASQLKRNLTSERPMPQPLQFKSSKRGRRPSFTNVGDICNLTQVSILGSPELAKAS